MGCNSIPLNYSWIKKKKKWCSSIITITTVKLSICVLYYKYEYFSREINKIMNLKFKKKINKIKENWVNRQFPRLLNGISVVGWSSSLININFFVHNMRLFYIIRQYASFCVVVVDVNKFCSRFLSYYFFITYTL